MSSPPTSLDTLLAIAIPLFLASSAYCSELKAKLQARERELEEGRAELVLLQEELRHTRSQLSEARSKLELYAEKEKLVEAAGREAEKVYTSSRVILDIILNYLFHSQQLLIAHACQVIVT